MLTDAYTNKGNSIMELSNEGKIVLVFLRHFGCNFCRETLHEISKLKFDLENKRGKLVLVHQASKTYAEEILKVYELENVEHISDTGNVLYQSYDLGSHSALQLLNPAVIFGVIKGFLKGHLPGKPVGNPYQLPGVFVLEKGKVTNSYRYRNIAKMPPFLKLAS